MSQNPVALETLNSGKALQGAGGPGGLMRSIRISLSFARFHSVFVTGKVSTSQNGNPR